MADIPAFNPNPYAVFDPSQWSNPYTAYSGGALPWPYGQGGGGYVGWPTDSLGNPIQAPPGMTLNSAPAAAAPAPAAPPQNNAQAGINLMLTQAAVDQARQQAIRGNTGTFGNTYTGTAGGLGDNAMLLTMLQQQRAAAAPQAKANAQALMPMLASGDWNGIRQFVQSGGAAAPGGGGQAAPAPAANSSGPTAQQYLSLLANPGKPPTYGATVPQAASNQESGVLSSFLKGWKPASSGPGSGFQQGFASALKGMGY